MKLLKFFLFFFFLIQVNSFCQSWEGIWFASKYNSLEITKVTSSSFSFVFNCYNGINLGELEGTAIISGNKARYDGGGEYNLCPIDFVLEPNAIKASEDRKNECDNGAGNGVYFTGTYKTTKKQNKQISKQKLSIVQNQEFETFWKEFQAGIIKKDKGKVANLTILPLEGYQSNNRTQFIQNSFDEIFDKELIQFLSKINNTNEGKINKTTIYSFVYDNNNITLNIAGRHGKSEFNYILSFNKTTEGYRFYHFEIIG